MANGNYSQSGGFQSSGSQSGGYRNDRGRGEREPSSDYRPGDTGHVRPNGDNQRAGDMAFGDRSYDPGDERGSDRDGDRARSSRYGRAEQWASDDFGYESGSGESDRSRLWARESYRGRPSSFSYEPGRDRVNQASGDRYGSDYRYGSGERYRHEPENRSPRLGGLRLAPVVHGACRRRGCLLVRQ